MVLLYVPQKTKMSKYSVVIPCYKSAKSIEQVVAETIEEFDLLNINDYEFVLVNDCSPDGGETLSKLYELARKYSFVKVIDLGKNAGQNNATMAGLNYVTGDFIISMDDDLQTSPSQIRIMKEKLEKGYDLVYGYYEVKKENWFRRWGSALNHWTVCVLINKPRWLRTSSFWIMRSYVRDYAIRYTHPSVHLQGVLLRITDNIACVPIQHYERVYGKSTYTLKKLIKLYSNIIGYSMKPITLVTYSGFGMAVLGFVVDAAVLVRRILTPEIVVGWTALWGVICFFSGILLVALGIIGSYVGRLFAGQTNSPQYVVRDLVNLEKEEIKGENE